MSRSTRGGHEVEPSAGVVRTARSGSTATLSVHGRLDGATGRILAAAARAAVVQAPGRLDIDLREVDAFTATGASALLECRDLGTGLADGVHYRTAGGAGGDALLVAYDGLASPENPPSGTGMAYG